jgi:hypothetical protein
MNNDDSIEAPIKNKGAKKNGLVIDPSEKISG